MVAVMNKDIYIYRLMLCHLYHVIPKVWLWKMAV